jgi:methanogenic corrinoid protein MtbC1
MLPLADELLVQFSAPDRYAAADLCIAHIESGTPLRELVDNALAPAMAQVGDLWQAAIWSVVDEHIATGVAETALSAAAGCERRTSASGEIVVACVEGDWHSLPSRMVAEVLDSEGWSVRFLGASHPTSMLTDYVRRHRPEAVLLSCAVPMALPALTCAVHALHELDTKEFVGGRALGTTPYRAAAVGADGWAASAPTSELLAQPITAPRPAAAFTRIDEHRELHSIVGFVEHEDRRATEKYRGYTEAYATRSCSSRASMTC